MVVISPISAGNTLDIGNAPNTARDDSIGQGLRNLGGAIQQAGNRAAEVAERLAQKQLTQKRFAASLQQRKIDAELDAELVKLQGDMEPNAAGYVDAVNKLVQSKYDTFFRSLDPVLQQEFGPQLDARGAEWQAGAVKVATAQEQTWYQQGVNEVIDEAAGVVYSNPGALADGIASIDQSIADSGLYSIEAEASRRKGRITLQQTVVERAIADGDMSLLPMLGIASPDNADAAALIRGFEGLRTNAYADTRTSTGQFDAWRAGYGSDTITLADGTVRAVTQGTVITADDAERDLQRRVGEFQRTIIGQVGVDTWAALPASARAGLTSVAYNYGSLPKSVVGAVKGGDVQAIASAVAALDANPDRRRREAAAILGEAQPSAEFSDLPFEARRQLYDRLAVAGKATIETATTNAPSAIMNTGNYSGTMPTAQQFVAAYGPADGADRYRAFEASVEVARTAHTMRTMPLSDISAVVESYRPTSSGTDAALETEQFNQVQAAAAATRKARSDDPAAYTRTAFPEVGKAWEAVSAAQAANSTATPLERTQAYRAALTATISAQRTLGIAQPIPLPDGMAAGAVATWKDKTASADARVAQTVALLQGTDDVSQQAAIWSQLVNAGIPVEAGGAFEALSRGDHAAAQRLFQAALFDPADLKEKLPESPDKIREAVTAGLMHPGQIGDIYYGLTDGDVPNFERAAADAKLINNAVTLRVRSGEPLDQAVQAVGRDLFGDVSVIRGQNVSVLVDADTLKRVDAGVVQSGFQALLPRVKEAMAMTSAVAPDLPTADSTKAILTAAESNHRDRILSEGYFRNAGEGFVYIDPFGGTAIEGPDGNPLVFSMEDVLVAANVAAEKAAEAAKADPVAEYVRQRALALSAPGNLPADE